LFILSYYLWGLTSFAVEAWENQKRPTDAKLIKKNLVDRFLVSRNLYKNPLIETVTK